MDIEQVARICHETNRAYCQSIGDWSQVSWDDAADWMRESAINGVKFRLANPDLTPGFQHMVWLQGKFQNGWKYGLTKDAEKKEHPRMVSYDKLPKEQRVKDYLFQAIVDTFMKAEEEK